MAKQSYDEFHAALGRLVIAWNVAEGRIRSMLGAFCGQENRTELLIGSILTVELGGMGMSNALQAVAGDILKSHPASSAVKHIATWSDLLRAHRNYLVHGLVDVLPSEGSGIGWISTRSAKTVYLVHNEIIDLSRLVAFSDQAAALTAYVNSVTNHLFWQADPERPQLVRPPLPDKPPLPESLRKPRSGLR